MDCAMVFEEDTELRIKQKWEIARTGGVERERESQWLGMMGCVDACPIYLTGAEYSKFIILYKLYVYKTK